MIDWSDKNIKHLIIILPKNMRSKFATNSSINKINTQPIFITYNDGSNTESTIDEKYPVDICNVQW